MYKTPTMLGSQRISSSGAQQARVLEAFEPNSSPIDRFIL